MYYRLSLFLLFSFIHLSLSINDPFPVCGIRNCPAIKGQCVKSECVCTRGYVTAHLDRTKPFEYCNYEQISRWVPFILEFLIPTSGNFYVGHTMRGFIKLIFLIGPILIWGFGYILKNACYKDTDEIINSVSFISLLVLLGFFLFQLTDLILYGIAYLPDGNGIPLM